MSLVAKGNRISVKQFAAVPALLELPAVVRPDALVSNVSSIQGAGGKVNLVEGCLLTKSIKYTHQLAHMVNAAHSGDSTLVVSENVISTNSPNHFSFQEAVVNHLSIIPYLPHFAVDCPCNLVYCKSWKYV
jgi:hypothetical protein